MENEIKSFIIRTLIDHQLNELNNPNAYTISLIETDIIETVSEWSVPAMKEWLSYHCNIDLDNGDELPTIEE